MPSPLREPTAEELFAAVQADIKLDAMALHEDLGERWEKEAWAYLREEFAERYRELVGVHPADRHELREALLRISNGEGNRPVPDLIALFRSGYRPLNHPRTDSPCRSGSPGDGAAASASPVPGSPA